MKIANILALLFFLAAIVFAYLYFRQRPDAVYWGRLGINSDSASAIHERHKNELRDAINQKKVNLIHLDSSLLFDDARLARAYIDTFDLDTADLNDYGTKKGRPRLTTEVWMDGNTVCALAKLIVQNNFDGVRLYLAKYPAIANMQDPERMSHTNDQGNYDHRYTLVVVTTKADSSSPNNHIDVFRDATGAVQGVYNYHDVCPPTCPSTGAILNQP